MAIPRMNPLGEQRYKNVNDSRVSDQWLTTDDPGAAGVNENNLQSKQGEIALPICPYGCGRQGTLLEIVMKEDGTALGIFNDFPCSCIFYADVSVGEPPTKRKLVIGPDGELHEQGT